MRCTLHTLRSGEIGEGEQCLPDAERLAAWQLQDGAVLRTCAGLFHLILALEGNADIRCSDGQWPLTARRWLLLGRDVAPVVRGRSRAHVLCVALDARALSRLDPAGQLIAPVRGTMGLAAWRMLRSLQARSALEGIAGSLDEACAEEFLASLLARSDVEAELCLRTPGRTELRRRQLLSRMLRARMYIEGHADRVVRITELARLCSFSPWHFTKTFHQIFGETPQGCGVRVRLERARKLVVQSRLAISEIAAASGFENASSFARAFHERYGECASQMRARAAPCPTPLRRSARR